MADGCARPARHGPSARDGFSLTTRRLRLTPVGPAVYVLGPCDDTTRDRVGTRFSYTRVDFEKRVHASASLPSLPRSVTKLCVTRRAAVPFIRDGRYALPPVGYPRHKAEPREDQGKKVAPNSWCQAAGRRQDGSKENVHVDPIYDLSFKGLLIVRTGEFLNSGHARF